MTVRNVTGRAAAAVTLMLVLAACGGDGGTDSPTATPTGTRTGAPTTPTGTRSATPTVTPTLAGGSGVSGVVVVHQNVAANRDDALGVPPAELAGQVDAASFARALAFADWTVVDGADVSGTTGPDGRFEILALSPGRHQLSVTKTANGNLIAVTIPFAVGPDGRTEVVAEVSWGQVRSMSTYIDDGVEVREVRSPSGSWLVIRDGRLIELGTPGRVLRDADGDGRFDAEACAQTMWSCAPDPACEDGRVCGCVASCPACRDCGVTACVPPGAFPPYRCDDDGGCAQPGDRCVCVSSCPECDDCVFEACVPGCDPVDITAISISASSQLILGQQGWSNAAATLSDGTMIDVTALADWQSADESVATVDSWGTIRTHALGKTNLTASLGELTSNPWAIEVVERPSLRRIHLQNVSCYFPLWGPVIADESAPPILDVPVQTDILPAPSCGQIVLIGATIQFRALGEFGDGAYYEDITDEVDWRVAPSEVGDVVGGLFTGRQVGTARLSAALGAVESDPTEIRVVAKATLVGISIYAGQGIRFLGPPWMEPDDPTAALVEPCFDCGYAMTVLRGDELSFHATGQYDTGEWRDVTGQVAWRSSDATVAAIDPDGVMLAIVAGTAVIDATLDEVVSQPVSVRVVNEATLLSLYIYPEGTDRVVAKGDQAFFHAQGYYDVGFERDVTNEATWRSSDGTVGGFDQAGVFTGRAAGTATVWAELGDRRSEGVALEVYETSELTYCDPDHINRALWSDDFNRVILESDCAEYVQPGVATVRYTVTETQPHGGIFDPCLDLYVYRGDTRVRTLREEGCGEPFLARTAAEFDAVALKYQLRAFWDLRAESGERVPPGTYTILGRFYLYYDPVVSIDVTLR